MSRSHHLGSAILVLSIVLYGTHASPASEASLRCSVEVEELVTSYKPANNGASPLWCYGATVIARRDQDVFLSVIETGEGIPPLLNTRWQLWRRSEAGWRLLQSEKDFRQREPCPIAVFHNGPVLLSVNPSLEPAGATRGRCEPLVLEFDPDDPNRPPISHRPAWAEGTHFTEHSYRGLAADGAAGEILLLNIDSKTGDQFLSYRDRGGQWSPQGKVVFPIRSCYPQVALRSHAAHILAIGDIVEPVEAWKKLKYERLKNDWDYVFRRLFYTYTPDIRETACCPPVEIDTVEETCGHILNLDLHIDDAGAAHVLYIKKLVQYDFIRDAYFPDRPMRTSLEYAVIKDGRVRLRATLTERTEGKDGLLPSYARFHVGGDSCSMSFSQEPPSAAATGLSATSWEEFTTTAACRNRAGST